MITDGSCGILVCIVTCYRLDVWGLNPMGTRDFLFFIPIQTSPVPSIVCTSVPVLFARGKAAKVQQSPTPI